MNLSRLDVLGPRGRHLLSEPDIYEADRLYEEWCDDVVDLLAAEAPGSGLATEWSAIGPSPLIIGNENNDERQAWYVFRTLVNKRLEWLVELPRRLSAGRPLPTTPRVPADYDQSVFLNCPFDDQFLEMRNAAVFTLIFLGMHVRCALDTADGSRVRIEKLYDLIRSSRFGVHDLSRTELDRTHGLPRFNMPLELGIFLGVKDAGGPVQARKVALITGSEPYQYQKYLSDVAGQDAVAHSNEPQLFSNAIRDWIAHLRASHLPSGSRVWERYRQFSSELEARCREARQAVRELTYRDFLRHVDDFCASTTDELVVGSGQKLHAPTRAQIRTVLSALPGGDNSFAILSKSGSGLSYMQTAGGPSEGFVLEWQRGSTDAHFRCAVPALDAEDVIRAFVRYAEDDPALEADLPWEPIDLFARST